MDEAVLHIGAPKAGSSTLQKTLAQNWHALRQLHRIGVSRESERLLHFAVSAEKEFCLPAFKGSGQIDRAIFSYEKLFTKIVHESRAKHLVEGLGQHFTRISALCYLRRPDETIVSGYSTAVLAGRTERFSEIPRMSAPLQSRLLAWEAALPPGGLAVRRFGNAYFATDFISDFLEALTIPESAIVARPFANASPTSEVIELQRLLNLRFQAFPRRRHLQKLLNLSDLPGGQIGLSRREREAILAECRDDSRWIARRYFNSDELFDHPIADDASPDVVLEPRDVQSITNRVLEIGGIEPTRSPRSADMGDMLDWCFEMLQILYEHVGLAATALKHSRANRH